MTRREIANIIITRLQQSSADIQSSFRIPGCIESAIIDDLLPEPIALEVASSFPPASQMSEVDTLREHKFTAKQLSLYPPIIEAVTLAFQEPDVVQAVCRATGFPDLLPDSSLYAGGISLMQRGNFLLPHLDNSHDAERGRYRRLNLLYYVTPHWSTEEGGHLELWDNGPKHSPRQLESRFNRLVIMATHKNSWHSVCEVKANRPRLCVSNYYYSDQPYEGDAYFHVTSFRARPDQPARDLLLRTDNALRSAIRKVAKKGVYRPETFQHKDKGVDS